MGNGIEIAIVGAVIVAALFGFVSQRLRVEIVAMGVLMILALAGLVTVPEALSGFSSPAVVTVGAVLVISGGLIRTGVAGIIGRGILRVAGDDEVRIVALIMITVALMSAFVNNIAATAVLLPAVMELARRAKISPSKFLIPLSFGSLLGGVTTLIGTPSNILVNEYLVSRGLKPFSFFDFTPVGLVIIVVGIAFMVLVGRRVLPIRRSADDLRSGLEHPMAQPEAYHLEERLFEVRIPEGSSLDGKRIGQTRFRQAFHLTIVGIVREGETKLAPGTSAPLCSGDLLLVKGRPGEVARLESEHKLELEVGAHVGLEDLESKDVGVFEAILAPHSDLVGKTLREIRFREKYGLSGLAIWRKGRVIRVGIGDQPLEFGDAFLIQGPRSKLQGLRANGDFLILEAGYEAKERPHKAPYAMGALVATVILAVLGILPISMAALIGAGLMVLTGCLSVEEAYESIDWRAIFLIAGMLPAGIAMEKSGAAQFLAQQIMNVTRGQPFATLFGMLTLPLLLSQMMPNPATAVLMAPVAFNAAQSVGHDPHIFLLGVGIAASMAFLTPIGHPANILVMGPGGYRFTDYIKVGLGLSVLALATMGTVLALVYG